MSYTWSRAPLPPNAIEQDSGYSLEGLYLSLASYIVAFHPSINGYKTYQWLTVGLTHFVKCYRALPPIEVSHWPERLPVGTASTTLEVVALACLRKHCRQIVLHSNSLDEKLYTPHLYINWRTLKSKIYKMTLLWNIIIHLNNHQFTKWYYEQMQSHWIDYMIVKWFN